MVLEEKAETRQFRWWLAPCEPALQWAAVVAANIDELAISTPRLGMRILKHANMHY